MDHELGPIGCRATAHVAHRTPFPIRPLVPRHNSLFVLAC